jgi:excinuclease ABC subunit C
LQHQIRRCSAPCVGIISKEEYARDVENAILFLEGDSDAITKSLGERMEKSSAALDYERAAQYRDQLARLNTVRSEQLVSRSKGNFDVIGLASDHGVYCVAVMFFRRGRSLGTRNYFPRVVEGATEEEIIRAFLLQFYGGRDAPSEILVSRAVPEGATMAEMLTERAGRRVQIRWNVRGDRARWLEMASTNARYGAELRSRSTATLAAQYEALAEALELDETPARIECFDISHTSGAETVASCVVFGPEGPLKSDYRRFNIKGIEPGDDYAAMNQVLRRRYARVAEGHAPMPDVVLIDGGRGQLGEAVAVLAELKVEGIRLVGVAKGEGRKAGRESIYVPGPYAPLDIPASSPALHIIQQIRDEAHRFAITGHRGRRQKRLAASPLDEIAGLGPKRRRDLLREFGGLQAVARAGIDDLARVRGVSRALAQSIYDRLHAD